MFILNLPFLPTAWILIISFCIVMYVILDGFTLGTGILFPFMNPEQRDIATSAILPNWDGNQTWLVLGTASLYGAFPLAFSMILPMLYMPLILMVVALIFRGVVFEFRLKSKRGRKNWDIIFGLSSLVVTFIQGLILGNFVEGFYFGNKVLEPTGKNVFSLFSLFTAFSLIAGYILLGSTRLILKTEDELQRKMYKIAWNTTFIVAFAMAIVSLWTPFINELVFNRWFENYNWLWLSPLPMITTLFFGVLIYSLWRKKEKIPYYASIALFLCPYIGFIISIYPFIVPYKITFIEAAAPISTLRFIFVGAVIMLPILIIYTGYSYRIFRGKVRDVIHY